MSSAEVDAEMMLWITWRHTPLIGQDWPIDDA